MANTVLHKLFEPVRRNAPAPVARALRAGATALLTPVHFSQHTGHWLSSLKSKALSPKGAPLPWYTYPCIDFLAARRDRVRSVLEFGAGQSTLWWAERGARVVAFEADRGWYEHLKTRIPANVDLRFTTTESAESCLRDVRAQLDRVAQREFDVVVVDGLYRAELTEVARSMRDPRGLIICDDSEGYGIGESLSDSGLNRVDFFGFAPGVILPRCTSIYFGHGDFFDAKIPIARATD